MWNERKWLMVQEPQTQDLRVELFDWDRINAKELLTINLLKGFKDTLGSKRLMGRSVLASRCHLSSLIGVWSCDFRLPALF